MATRRIALLNLIEKSRGGHQPTQQRAAAGTTKAAAAPALASTQTATAVAPVTPAPRLSEEELIARLAAETKDTETRVARLEFSIASLPNVSDRLTARRKEVFLKQVLVREARDEAGRLQSQLRAESMARACHAGVRREADYLLGAAAAAVQVLRCRAGSRLATLASAEIEGVWAVHAEMEEAAAAAAEAERVRAERAGAAAAAAAAVDPKAAKAKKGKAPVEPSPEEVAAAQAAAAASAAAAAEAERRRQERRHARMAERRGEAGDDATGRATGADAPSSASATRPAPVGGAGAGAKGEVGGLGQHTVVFGRASEAEGHGASEAEGHSPRHAGRTCRCAHLDYADVEGHRDVIISLFWAAAGPAVAAAARAEGVAGALDVAGALPSGPEKVDAAGLAAAASEGAKAETTGIKTRRGAAGFDPADPRRAINVARIPNASARFVVPMLSSLRLIAASSVEDVVARRLRERDEADEAVVAAAETAGETSESDVVAESHNAVAVGDAANSDRGAEVRDAPARYACCDRAIPPAAFAAVAEHCLAKANDCLRKAGRELAATGASRMNRFFAETMGRGSTDVDEPPAETAAAQAALLGGTNASGDGGELARLQHPRTPGRTGESSSAPRPPATASSGDGNPGLEEILRAVDEGEQQLRRTTMQVRIPRRDALRTQLRAAQADAEAARREQSRARKDLVARELTRAKQVGLGRALEKACEAAEAEAAELGACVERMRVDLEKRKGERDGESCALRAELEHLRARRGDQEVQIQEVEADIRETRRETELLQQWNQLRPHRAAQLYKDSCNRWGV